MAPYAPRVSASRCGGGQIRDPIYNKQYNWIASGKPTVYPFVDDDGGEVRAKKTAGDGSTVRDEGNARNLPSKDIRPRPESSSSLPGVRCGSQTRGRIVKPGRLGSAANYVYVSKKHVDPTTFIFVQGRNFGRKISPPPLPSSLPDEEKLPMKANLSGKGMEWKKEMEEEEEETNALGPLRPRASTMSSTGTSPAGKALHTSTVSLNISVPNMEKREKILQRLKLLETERALSRNPSRQEVADREKVIRFSDPEEDLFRFSGNVDNIEDEIDEITRPCSTCDTSIDYLECSKEENRRKLAKLWLGKEDETFLHAFEKEKELVELSRMGSPEESPHHSNKVSEEVNVHAFDGSFA